MSLANVGSKWSSGSLTFFNKATGATIFSIGLTGITVSLASLLTGTVTCSGDLELSTGQYVKGERFLVVYPQIAAADVAKTFFIAPAACKMISIAERHVTVAGQPGVLTIEKLNDTEAPGAGDDLLTTGLDLAGTANLARSENSVGTAAATLAAGDALCLKMKSGAATSYALGTIVVTMEWL